ncbi:MAG: HEAT repeat domain-containing protein, partial [Planctomycetota bacterium]
TERTIREFGEDLPRIKKTFLTGTSEERLKAIKFINRNLVSLTHDQSFIRALDACSQDSDANVRAGAASFLGYNYIWGKSVEPKEVIEILLRLSKDKDRGVRYQAVYCGLSVVENKDESIIERLVEMALDKTSDFGRISWGLSRGADEEIIKKYLIPHLTHESTKAKLARKLYRELFKEEPPEVERKPTVHVESKEP